MSDITEAEKRALALGEKFMTAQGFPENAPFTVLSGEEHEKAPGELTEEEAWALEAERARIAAENPGMVEEGEKYRQALGLD